MTGDAGGRARERPLEAADSERLVADRALGLRTPLGHGLGERGGGEWLDLGEPEVVEQAQDPTLVVLEPDQSDLGHLGRAQDPHRPELLSRS